MPRQYLRVVETRRLDNPDDQRTPEQVRATDSSAANLEVYVQSIITQLRRILGAPDWKEDPAASLIYLLAHLGVQQQNLIWNEDLSGIKDGVNKVFHTAHPFELDTLRVFWNGVRLHSGIGYDFVVSESGGMGTGYDTVTLLGPAPRSEESVYADYLRKP